MKLFYGFNKVNAKKIIRICLFTASVLFLVNGTILYAQSASDVTPPVIFSLHEMPRVDIHMHLNRQDQIDDYINAMDRVGIDVSVVLNTVSKEAVEYASQYNGRLLFAPRPVNREELWWSNNELDELKQAGYAGTKLWVAYSPVITEEEFGRSIHYQGEIGLPLIGMHVANPPSGAIAIKDFEEQVGHAIRVIRENPETTFIMAHGIWHMVEDRWLHNLDNYLETYPNLYVDLSAAAQAFGFSTLNRDYLREFIIKWKDRILFGTDGSLRHSEERFFYYWYRILETDQHHLRGFFGGEIGIQGLALPLDVLNHLYWWNAARLVPRVQEALLARGYPIDNQKPYQPSPRIVHTETGLPDEGGKAKLTVITDQPAEVRWSFSNLPYVRMDMDKKLTGRENGTVHELHFKPVQGENKIFVSAGARPGHSMTIAIPIRFINPVGETGPEETNVRSDIDSYQIVAMDRLEDGIHQNRLNFPGLEPFREAYIRFWMKTEANHTNQVKQWRVAYQPNKYYEPEHVISGRQQGDGYIADFLIDGKIQLEAKHNIKPDTWQEHIIRFDINRNLFEILIDGEVILQNEERMQLAGMWGNQFDTIQLLTGEEQGSQVERVLVLTGPGSYLFSDTDETDRQPPQVVSTLPAEGSENYNPESPLLIEFKDEGMGIDAKSVVVDLNGLEIPVHVMGTPNQGFIVVELPENTTDSKVKARVVFSDLSNSANTVEYTWNFGVALHAFQVGSENIALHRVPNVHATYTIPDRLLAEGRRSYNAESLTDGRIEPDAGSTLNWASGTGGRQLQWVEIDFEDEKKVSMAKVYPVLNHGIYQTPTILIVEAWDGEAYVPVSASYTPEETGEITIRMPVVQTSKIRISQPPFVSRLLWLTEVEIYGPDVVDIDS